MQNSAPSERPQDSSELSREEWVSNLLLNGALRTRLRSLPVIWMIVVSAVVFPIGVWSQMDAVGLADESETAVQTPPQPGAEVSQSAPATANNEPEPDVAALPELPNPNLENNNEPPAPVMRTMSLRVLVSGKIFEKDLTLPDGATVRDVIAAMNLKLYQHDRTFPAADSAVYHGQSIRITRVRTEEKTRSTAITPAVRYRPTTALRPGQEKTEQAGKPGVVELTERIWFKDGKVTLREKLESRTVRAASDKVIAVGARSTYLPGKIPYHKRYAKAYGLAARAGSPRDRVTSHETKTLRRVRSMTLTATGYSPDPRENGGYTVTATGLPIGYGAAAVDPRVIPLGTKLYVEGYGYAFACDVGGAIKGNKIDLAYNSYREANTKGRKPVKVWILAP